MARYTDASRERLRDAVDMVDLVGSRVELRRAGANRYTGLCPFHDERSPSFGIDPAQKVFYCFGCGQGGDLFRFVELTEGVDFKGAMELLADRYGVELELDAEDPRAAERRRARERLLELLERTAAYYVRVLWEAEEARRAREYLLGRGLEERVLREFRVGYAPSAWDRVLVASRRAGFTEGELVDAGLASKARDGSRLFDRFRRRITFPLTDVRGRVLGFGARAVSAGQQPKYLNTSETPVFHKGRNLFAADIARVPATKAGEVVLAEGYTDVIALHQAGLRNTVGLMGTALTEEQVGELSRLAPRVLLALDADSAGQEAMLRAAAVAEKRGVEMRVAQLPTGMDPADAVQRLGPAAAREALERPLHLRRFRVQRVLDKADMTSTGGRETALDELRREFAPVAPGALRDELLNLVADAYNRPGDVVAAWLGADPRGAAAASRAPAAEARREAERGAVMSARSMDPLGHAERALLAQAVATPAAGEALLRELDLDEYFSSALTRAAAGHLRDHITDPMNGLRQEDAQLGAFLAEIAVRATQLRNSTGILDAEARNLDLLHLERRIAESRTRGSGDVAALMIRREELRHRRDLLIERAMQETETAER